MHLVGTVSEQAAYRSSERVGDPRSAFEMAGEGVVPAALEALVDSAVGGLVAFDAATVSDFRHGAGPFGTSRSVVDCASGAPCTGV